MSSRFAAPALAGAALVALVLFLPRGGDDRAGRPDSSPSSSGGEAFESRGVSADAFATADPWTRRLAAAHIPRSEKPGHGVLEEFSAWRKGRRDDLVAGLDLARQRREVLEDLIKRDPGAAWDEMLSRKDRQSLPEEIRMVLEMPVEGTADWHEYAICFSTLPFSGFREVRFTDEPDRVFFGFPVGNLAEAGSVDGIRVKGYVMGDLALLDGEPPRRLAADDPIPAGAGVDRFDPFRGTAVVREEDIAGGLVPRGSHAYFDGETVRFFESENDLETYAASPGNGEEGGEEGGGTAGAPDESATGQPDSLPLSGRQGGSVTGGDCLDYRTLLYVRLAFSDDPGEVVETESAVYSKLRGVNDHLLASSYGRMQILPTVTPIIELPQSEAFYQAQGTSKLAADAFIELLKPANGGYVPGNYGHRVYRYSGGPGTFGGFAQVGVNPGNIWLRSSSSSILTHEIGHNYKLQHSNQWNTGDKAAIGPSGDTEYGHKNDIMGAGADFSKAQFCSFQKKRLGWLKDSEYIESIAGGRHRIHALDSETVDPDKSYAIKVPTGGRGNYWAEYRRNYTLNAFKNGLLLQGEGTGWSTINSLMPSRIDVTWWSKKALNDTPVPIGMTFSDHQLGVHITPLARDDNQAWMDVQVRMGPFPGNRAPTASINATTTTPNIGQAATFTVTANDPDGDELATWWYFDDDDLHAFREYDELVRVKSWPSAGVRSVIVAVSDMKGGVAWLRSDVTVGTPGDFSISGRVTDAAGTGVGGVAVDNGLSKVATNYRVTLTDDDGFYVLGRVPAGSYTVMARRDYDDYAPMGFLNPVSVGPDAVNIDFEARTLSVTSIGSSLGENGGTAMFRLERVGGASGDFTGIGVRFLGEAVMGSDYTVSPAPVSDTYTLPAGQPFMDVTVAGMDDGDVEGAEDIILALGMTNDLSVIDNTTTSASLVIDDDESALPRVALTSLTGKMTEGGSATGQVRRYGSTAAPLTIQLVGGAGAIQDVDWEFVGDQSVTIVAGESTATFDIAGIPDSLIEGTEQVQISMQSGSFIEDATDNQMIVNLADDDVPALSVASVDPIGSEPSMNPGHIRISRSGDVSGTLAVLYGVRGTALHGTDYQQLSGVASIPAGRAYTDVVILPIVDAISESDEAAIIRLASDDSDYRLEADKEGTVDIWAATPIVEPSLTIASAGNGNEPTDDPVNFTVTRAGSTTGALTVDYFIEGGTATPGADYVTPSGSIIIANGEATGTISLDPNIDGQTEPDETVIISLVPAHGYLVGSPSEATGELWDVDMETQWKRQFFGDDWNNPAVSGDLVDFEGDGIVNLLEYGLFLDPTVSDREKLPQPVMSGGFFTITYSQRKNAGLSYTVLGSESLQPGSFDTTGISFQIVQNTPEKLTLRARVIRANFERKYLIVEVVRN